MTSPPILTSVAETTPAGPVAQADRIRLVNEAIAAGGENYLRYRQVEMLPQIAPLIADALAKARMVTINSSGESGHGDGAPGATTDNITGVIRTVLAAQLMSRTDLLAGDNGAASNGAARSGK